MKGSVLQKHVTAPSVDCSGKRTIRSVGIRRSSVIRLGRIEINNVSRNAGCLNLIINVGTVSAVCLRHSCPKLLYRGFPDAYLAVTHLIIASLHAGLK